MPFPLALALSATIALAGWRLAALTPAGAFTAVPIGTAILGLTGWPGLAALGAFFAGSSVVSRVAPDRSAELLDAMGSTRDAAQVLANGGAAAVGALLELFLPGAGIWVVTASLAAAAADTFATSTGGWSRRPPRNILTGRPVPAGTSGGITLLGSGGALVGAALVGGSAVLLSAPAALFPLALGVGMLGMLADSAMGAGWQARFHCPACDRATERPVHRCGRRAVHTGGWPRLGNDGVNAIATALAAALGLAGWWWMG